MPLGKACSAGKSHVRGDKSPSHVKTRKIHSYNVFLVAFPTRFTAQRGLDATIGTFIFVDKSVLTGRVNFRIQDDI